VWVPNRSSIRGELGIFVDQSTEPVVASRATGRVVMQPRSSGVVEELSRRLVPTK
jgi:hypothetical protein